ncbi:hypothetical protein [Streptomyces liangshanensis]|uniref:hypothetical protein n=1 Tax=Streptomyces liangshanensis TaxID=2717324 RepID=UPI0036D836A2
MYEYVGPVDIRAASVRAGGEGTEIRSSQDLASWIATRAGELAEPFTFVVDEAGVLRLAPRRSEHVACAGGGAVLSAGEMSFVWEDDRWVVDEVSNQSTGYCPDVSSWQWVAAALERAGVERAGVVRLRGFTHEVVFRRCVGEGADSDCREVSVVREDDFFCVFCGGGLPAEWNVGVGVGVQAGT